MQKEAKPSLDDLIALMILKLAKLNRKKMSNHEDYETFYEEFFEQKDAESYTIDARMRIRRETILNYLNNFPKSSSVIDVGCGLGDVLEQLPEHFNLFGVDYARSNVAYAKQKLNGKAQIFESGIYSLPFESEYFDIALCLEVLEHIEDDAKAVSEISRILKPGGVLIAAVPYTFYWKSYKKLLGHFRHYSRNSFTELLLKNGFTSIDKYLPNYYRWHQKYSRSYAGLVANHKFISFFKTNKSIYEFKYPWSDIPAIKKLEFKLEYQKQLDEKLDYNSNDHSTFIAARK